MTYTINRTSQGLWEVLAPSGITVCWCPSQYRARITQDMWEKLSPEEFREACDMAAMKREEDYREAAG